MKLLFFTFLKSIGQMTLFEEQLWGTASATTTDIWLKIEWK